MKELKCENCGSNDLVNEDGIVTCKNCGRLFIPEKSSEQEVEDDYTDIKNNIDIIIALSSVIIMIFSFRFQSLVFGWISLLPSIILISKYNGASRRLGWRLLFALIFVNVMVYIYNRFWFI
jgi:hypothetical protein